MLTQTFLIHTHSGEFNDLRLTVDPDSLTLRLNIHDANLPPDVATFAAELGLPCDDFAMLEARYRRFAAWLHARTEQFIGGGGHDNAIADDLRQAIDAAQAHTEHLATLAERASHLPQRASRWPAVADEIAALFAEQDPAAEPSVQAFARKYFYGSIDNDALAASIAYVIAFESVEQPPQPGCKFGGFPNLPEELSWPDGDYRFLAQLDFAALAPLDLYGHLPTSGVCFVFIDYCGEPFTVLGADAFGPKVIAREGASEPTYPEYFWRPQPSFYITGSGDTHATRQFARAMPPELLAQIQSLLGMAPDGMYTAADADRIFGEPWDWQGMHEPIEGVFFTHLDANGFSVNIGVHPDGLRLHDYSVMSYFGSGT